MKSLVGLALLLSMNVAKGLTNSVPAEDPRWQSVVLIAVNGKDDSGDIVPGLCTATLVDPQVLLTAAHCVNDALALKDRGIEITTGHYIYHQMPDGTQRRIGYKPDHPVKLNATFLISDANPSGNDDVAIVVLDQAMNLPANFPFAQIASTVEANSINQNLSVYLPSLVTNNPVAEISTTNTLVMASLNQISWSFSGNYQSKSGSRVEPGDSGAPLFIKTGTQWKMLAVVKGQAKTFFSDWDVFESLSSNLCRTATGRVSPGLQKKLCL